MPSIIAKREKRRGLYFRGAEEGGGEEKEGMMISVCKYYGSINYCEKEGFVWLSDPWGYIISVFPEVIHAAPAMYVSCILLFKIWWDDTPQNLPMNSKGNNMMDLPYHKKELTSYETSCSVRWCNATKKQILFVKAWVWLHRDYVCMRLYVQVHTGMHICMNGICIHVALFEGAKYERISMYVHRCTGITTVLCIKVHTRMAIVAFKLTAATRSSQTDHLCIYGA